MQHCFVRQSIAGPLEKRCKCARFSTMITATQIRGARAMIGMSIEELAAASGLPVETVTALENGEFAGEPHALFDVRSTLEAHGIIFLSSGNQDEGAPASGCAHAAPAMTASGRKTSTPPTTTDGTNRCAKRFAVP